MLGDRTRTPILRVPRLFTETLGPVELTQIGEHLAASMASS